MPNDRYDHRRYAANQGDVWKHALLVEVLSALERPKLYFESHAGPGPVTLAPGGEWERGLGRLLKNPGSTLYEKILAQHPAGTYPGSSALAQSVSPGIVLVLHDIHEARDGVLATDGYAALRDTPSIDLALIDPPFGRGSRDWDHLSDPKLTANCRAFLLWYPIFSPLKPDVLVTARSLPGFELVWADLDGPVDFASKGAGLLAGGEAARILAARRPMLEELAHRLGGRLNVRQRI